jgi:hypothetical protein
MTSCFRPFISTESILSGVVALLSRGACGLSHTVASQSPNVATSRLTRAAVSGSCGSCAMDLLGFLSASANPASSFSVAPSEIAGVLPLPPPVPLDEPTLCDAALSRPSGELEQDLRCLGRAPNCRAPASGGGVGRYAPVAACPTGSAAATAVAVLGRRGTTKPRRGRG